MGGGDGMGGGVGGDDGDHSDDNGGGGDRGGDTQVIKIRTTIMMATAIRQILTRRTS